MSITNRIDTPVIELDVRALVGKAVAFDELTEEAAIFLGTVPIAEVLHACKDLGLDSRQTDIVYHRIWIRIESVEEPLRLRVIEAVASPPSLS